MIKDFTDLEVYQLALDLSEEVYQPTQKFPDCEKFGIIDQLKRASSSVGANIAEGYGRYYKKDFIKFLYTARGSLNEVRHFLMLAHRLKYLDKNTLEEFEAKIKNLSIKLNNLISSTYRNIDKWWTTVGQPMVYRWSVLFLSNRVMDFGNHFTRHSFRFNNVIGGTQFLTLNFVDILDKSGEDNYRNIFQIWISFKFF